VEIVFVGVVVVLPARVRFRFGCGTVGDLTLSAVFLFCAFGFGTVLSIRTRSSPMIQT
jgi:hypothetical protein